MLKHARPRLILLLAMVFAGPVLADSDPTLHQIYEAAQTGHLSQAQQMINQVLRDHPKSAKAHYVAAELYAKGGNVPLARQELSTAEQLEPGLPFAKQESVQALQRQVSQSRSVRGLPASSEARGSFPWGIVLMVVAGVAVFWFVLQRRRASANTYSQYAAGVPAVAGTPGSLGGGVMAPNVGGGIGSGIAGGLATGLAVGAGVVAGEELARHFLDSDRREGSAPPLANEPVENPDANSNMGGSDFGVSDSSSWDDGGGGFGGVDGGDDWT